MANIALRAYLDDLAHLIDQEALEEVIGHCKYILTKFPKNVAVYRLYGTALAGKSRYDEARDIFERVLSVVPNDFAAHVSMSEIFQEQGLEGLPRAIWHLERAFEQDPNNAALQDELKRLYDQRDGAPPETINLTRGALARLYFKSQLYDQAAAELNVALRESPERPDLLILLAQAQWDNHRPVEAGETALRILQNFPYSMDANRLMAKLWLQNNRPSDAQEFVQRLAELDPFEALELVKPGDEGAKAEITIQRLDWNARSSATMLANAPDWVQGMGDFFTGPDPATTSSDDPFNLSGGRAGDWKSSFTAASDVPVPKTDWFSSSSPFAQAAQSKGTDDLPDWFADAQPTPAAASTASPASGLPSWLEDIEADPSTPTAPHQHTGFTDLLNEFGTPAQAAPPVDAHTGFTDLLNEFGAPSTGNADSGFSDLMNEFGGTSATPAASDPAVPSWLQDESQAAAIPEALPDWMQGAPTDFADLPNDFGVDVSSATAPAMDDWLTAPPVPESSATPTSEGLPDWMQNAPTFDESANFAADQPDANLPSLDVGVPDWLNSDGTDADALPAQPAEHLPDWLHEIPKVDLPATGTLPEVTAFPAPEFSELVIGQDQPPTEDWLAELAPPPAADLPADALSTADMTDDWLTALPASEASFAPENTTPIAELPSFPEMHPVAEDSTAPTDHWLDELRSAEPEQAEADEFASALEGSAAPIAQLPSFPEMHPIEADIPTPPTEDWLTALRGGETVPPVAAAPPAEEEPEDTDWLAALPEFEMGEFRTPQESNEPVPASDISTDWLKSLASEPSDADAPTQATEVVEPLLTAADIPAWADDSAADLDIPQASVPPAADPLDWMSETTSTDTVPDQDTAPAAQPISEIFGNDDDWLDSLGTNAEVEATTERSLSTDELLDWMSEENGKPTSTPTPSVVSVEAAPASVAADLDTLNLDDWMQDLAAEPTDMEALPSEPDVLPEIENMSETASMDDDWLRNFEIDAVPTPSSADLLPEVGNSAPAESASEVPIEDDWLASFEPEASIMSDLPVTPTGDNWLDQLAANAPPPREPLTLQEAIIEHPEEPASTFDWGTPPPAESPAEPAASSAAWLSSLGTSISPAEQAAPEPQETAPSWLQELPSIEAEPPPAAAQKKTGMTDMLGRIKRGEVPPPARETGVLNPNQVPDWMSVLGGEGSSTESSDIGDLGEMVDPPGTAILSQPGASTTLPPAASTSEADWLQDIAGIADSAAVPEAASSETETPDWLQNIGTGAADDIEPQVAGSDSDWLSDIRADVGEPEAETGDVPSWLQGVAPVAGSEDTFDIGEMPDLAPMASTGFDFGTETPAPAEPNADDIDINALLSELNASGVAKDAELVDNTDSSRFKFDRAPAWLRKRKN